MYQDRKIAAVNSKGKGKATMPAVTAGKKRKDQGRKANGKAAAVPAPLQAPEAEPELDEAGLLLREIKSLGGDEEDFKFLKDVDVDDEDEAIVNDTVEDKKLSKDLKSFLATLGDLGQAYGDDEEQQEEDVEAEQDEQDEEGSDSEESGSEEVSDAEGEVATAPAPKAPEPLVAASLTPTPVAQKPAPVSRSGMLVDPNPLWYAIELPELAGVPSGTAAPSTKTIDQLQKRGTQLLDEMSETFSGSLTRTDAKNDKLAMSSTLSASDRAFISTILQSGTSSDKLSALILLSSSSPIHTMTYLNQLASLTKKKSRDEAVRAIRAIVDWLKGGAGGTGTAGLPDRKLRWFAEQPDLHKVVHAREHGVKQNGKQPGDEQILVWAFEDWLKKWYFELLKAIETLSHDPLPFVRTQMTGFLASLLSSKPEQEQNLLRLLVDKLGDSDRAVSSRTSYHLLQLLQNHPMMKTIVVREIAALVLRPTASAPVAIASGYHGKKASAPSAAHPSATAGVRSSDHSRYYGIITLNQIMLSRTDQDKLVANRLIEVYFDIFKDLLGNYSEEDDAPQAEELKGRKQRRDEQKGGKRKRDQQAADKLKALPRKERRRIEKSQQALEAESKIMAAVLTGVNRAFPYSEIEGDVLHQRADVLFRIIHTGTFNVGIQALTLIFQVSSKQQAVSDRFYRALYDTLTDTRLANSSKQAMYLNLLFKAIKADTSAKRVAAFVKRILQTLGSHQPPFICGSLYLLGELFNITPSLRNMLSDPEDADDDLEKFKDAPESAEEAEEEVAASSSTRPTTSYDGRKRDPQYANAHNSCLWEITPLLHHFHPSVALHASQLLSATPISTTPDLELHTLSHFLDRFVYRNAKKSAGGSDSIMKPGAKGLDRSGMVLMRKGTTAMSDARVNADDFVKKQAADVPVDQLFFHKFFNQKLEDEKSKEVKSDRRKRRGDADANDDDISLGDSDEDGEESIDEDGELEQVGETDLSEKEIWKAMQASMPKAAGDDDDDDDLMADEDEDSDDVAEFAYSDSEDSAVGVDAVEEEDDEPQSFFPDEDDDELEGFAEEDDDVIGSDEDVDMPSVTDMPESKRAKKRKLKHLPAFADADDWKALIDAGDSDA